jgi:hypothetical protein
VRVVWKKQLELTENPQTFTLKGFEKVVHVAIQEPSRSITVWYLADPESTFHDSRTFQIFGTGDQEVPEDAVHLGTVLDGWFVWHIFEVPVPDEDA